MYLLDTDVVWALRGRPEPTTGDTLFAWAATVLPGTAFLSSIAMMEFESAVGRLARGDKATAAAIRTWLETRLRPAFEGRILPLDDAVVRRWALLGYADLRDGLLAATALEHGLTLATRNGVAFKGGRVRTFDPWSYSADAAELDWRQASQSAPRWLKSLFVRA